MCRESSRVVRLIFFSSNWQGEHIASLCRQAVRLTLLLNIQRPAHLNPSRHARVLNAVRICKNDITRLINTALQQALKTFSMGLFFILKQTWLVSKKNRWHFYQWKVEGVSFVCSHNMKLTVAQLFQGWSTYEGRRPHFPFLLRLLELWKKHIVSQYRQANSVLFAVLLTLKLRFFAFMEVLSFHCSLLEKRN